ncbi:MAG TPA: biotin transporter BioY [Candidatus Hydrogenedentes bacterium]|nr:biotin transporter BioY [Candidatus Hydrogenedentota bacterium]
MDPLAERKAMVSGQSSDASVVMPILEVIAVVAALFLATQVRFYLPFTPVPVTLQTLVVLVVPFWCRFWRATLGMAAFAMLGGVAAGLGVTFFASITGATWGYILGFLVVPAVAAAFPRRPGYVPLAMAAMLAVIYFFGAIWLAWWLDLPVYAAIMLGVLPFLPGDAVKLALAAGLVIWRDLRANRSSTAPADR